MIAAKSPARQRIAAYEFALLSRDLTVRDLANVLVVGAFRNGFIETLHDGNNSELLKTHRSRASPI